MNSQGVKRYESTSTGSGDRARSGGGIINHVTQFNKAELPFPSNRCQQIQLRRNRECVHNSAGLSPAALQAPPRSSRSQMHIKPRAYVPALSSFRLSLFSFLRARYLLSLSNAYAPMQYDSQSQNRSLRASAVGFVKQHCRELANILYVPMAQFRAPPRKLRRIEAINTKSTHDASNLILFFFFLLRSWTDQISSFFANVFSIADL